MKDKITDIFFDLDHTLWDFDRNSVLAFDRIFKEKYQNIETDKFIEVYIPINHACWKLYQFDKITHEELRYNRLKQSFDALDFIMSDDEIYAISHDYIEYLPDSNILFDGAVEILDYLQPNYNMHIITNGFADVQYRKINNSGIKDYFKTITNSEMAGVKKPHANIFEYALTLANTKKDTSIMIGDCIDADVFGAIDYGMKAILFDDKKVHAVDGIMTITHLLQLKNLL